MFTPYKNAWLKKLEPCYLKPYPTEKYAPQLARVTQLPANLESLTSMPSLAQMGFEDIDLSAQKIEPGSSGAAKLLADFLPRMAKY